MSDVISKLIADLDAKMFAMIAGDPLLIGTVKSNPAPSLTADRWDAMCCDFHTEGRIIPGKAAVNFQATLTPAGQAWAAGFSIVEVQPTPIYSQARAHSRRRINKKWLKRYGMKQTGWNYFLEGQLVVDEKHNVVYCHPKTAEQLRHEFTNRSLDETN